MSKKGVPLNLLPQRLRSVRLISLPNSVGIDPASANEDVFQASGRLHTTENEQRGRTAQFVPPDRKVGQVDELAEFRGD